MGRAGPRSSGDTRSSPHGQSDLTHFEVDAEGATAILVTDIDQPTTDDRFLYGVAGSKRTTSGTWSLDPELVNRKG